MVYNPCQPLLQHVILTTDKSDTDLHFHVCHCQLPVGLLTGEGKQTKVKPAFIKKNLIGLILHTMESCEQKVVH